VDESQYDQLMEQTRDALDRGDHVRALAIVDQLAALAPDDPSGCAIRAQVLLHADAGEEALSESRRAAELAPQNDRVHLFLGLAAWRCERLTLAQQSLERAIELSGGNPGMLVDYAWFMAVERGPRLAEDAALEAVAANGRSSTAWAALGLVQFRLHEREAAEKSLNRALKLDSADPYAQSVMIALLHDRNEDSKAEALLDLLTDTPGTHDVVEKIRRDVKSRRIASLLVERGVDRLEPKNSRRYVDWAWLAVAAALVAGLCAIFRPTSLAGVFICVVMPLSIYWLTRQMMDY
jgi:Tfp pilus assembly protein PilF